MSKVLVIEDEEDIKELIRTILTGNGFEVFTASDGEEGLASAVRLRPDLILLDLMMPGLSGLEICRLLKGRESTKHVPIIVVSALNRDVDKDYAFKAGADRYILKPFKIAEVLTTVDELMGKQPNVKSVTR